MTRAPQILERDQLLKAVDEIAPTVRAFADAAEAQGHLPSESVEALEAAGILRMMWPRCLGGYEADPVTQHEVIERLAVHDASTAWCGFIGAGSSSFVAANLPEQGLAEVQASIPAERSDAWVRVAGSPQPVGRATRVDGGFRIGGRWGWLSGVHHSDWVFLGAAVLDEGSGAPRMTDMGIPEALSFVVPTGSVVIEDSWDVAGMRGTGSAHVHVDDLFVPTHRSFDFPFNVPQRGGPLFRLPTLGFFGPAFSGFPQGVGQRAIEEIIDLAGSKLRVLSGKVLAERGAFQRDLGQAHDRLRAARALVRQELDRLWQGLHDDTAPGPIESAELLSAFTMNAEAALEATEVAYRYSGGDGVFASSPFQRLLRDMRVASQHILIGEYNTEAMGRVLLEQAQADDS